VSATGMMHSDHRQPGSNAKRPNAVFLRYGDHSASDLARRPVNDRLERAGPAAGTLPSALSHRRSDTS